MGMVHSTDELQRVIERQVAEGRAVSPTAFLDEAIMPLLDESRAEADDVRVRNAKPR